MNDRFSSGPWAALAAALAIASTGCRGQGPALAEVSAPEVTVISPVEAQIADEFEETGQTAAVEDVKIRARVSGYLLKKHVPDGAIVKKDQPLLKIDPVNYQAALDRARAEVARWQASVEKTQADMRRNEKLLPNGAVSREDYDLSVAQFKIAQAELLGAQANVRRCEQDVKDTEIVAPIDGRMGPCNFSIGDLVPAGGPDESSVLTSVATIDPMWVYFNMPERKVLELQDEARRDGYGNRPEHFKNLKWPASIGLANEQGHPHQGILDFVDNRIDPQTGTLRVRAVVDNSQQYFQPGMSVRVKLPVSDPRQVLLVPESAVGTEQGQKYLLTVDQESVVQRSPVKLGSQVALPGAAEPYRAISAGLAPAARVIVRGLQQARVGAKVVARQMSAPQAPKPAATQSAQPKAD